MLAVNEEPASLRLNPAAVMALPRLSKLIALVCVLLHIVYWIWPSAAVSMFAVQAGTAFSSATHMASFLTAGFLELSTLDLVLHVCLFLPLGNYFEPVWGSREFAKAVLFVNVSCSISILLLSLVGYIFTLRDEILFEYYWCGFGGIVAFLIVGLKQLVPEHSGTLFRVITIKVKQLPFILMCMYLSAILIGMTSPSMPFSILGLLLGWFYLRFVQRKPGSGGTTVVGDLDDAFTFASFFPQVAQPVVSMIVDPIYNLLVRLQFFSLLGVSVGRTVDGTSYGFSIVGATASLTDSLEAEQRRARAALVLEQRIAQTSPAPSKSAPQLQRPGVGATTSGALSAAPSSSAEVKVPPSGLAQDTTN